MNKYLPKNYYSKSLLETLPKYFQVSEINKNFPGDFKEILHGVTNDEGEVCYVCFNHEIKVEINLIEISDLIFYSNELVRILTFTFINDNENKQYSCILSAKLYLKDY